MATEDLAAFRREFEDAFIAPIASHEWRSRRARSHWVWLEGWQDSMAGPVSRVALTGGCEYVYSRDDWCFVAVHDPASLRRRLLEWHAGLAAGVAEFVAAAPEEDEDASYMRLLVKRMRQIVVRACEIEQARWSICHG